MASLMLSSILTVTRIQRSLNSPPLRPSVKACDMIAGPKSSLDTQNTGFLLFGVR